MWIASTPISRRDFPASTAVAYSHLKGNAVANQRKGSDSEVFKMDQGIKCGVAKKLGRDSAMEFRDDGGEGTTSSDE